MQAGEEPVPLQAGLRKFNAVNKVLRYQLKTAQERADCLLQEVAGLLGECPESTQKRLRRKAAEIQRLFKCEQCTKEYGSQVALNKHLKEKHLKEKHR
jgi:hypothetical protein